MKAVIYARYSSDSQREESIEAVSYTHLTLGIPPLDCWVSNLRP